MHKIKSLRFLFLATFALLCFNATANTDPDALIPNELAFSAHVQSHNNEAIDILWDVKSDYYLYKDKFNIEINGIKIPKTAISYPEGIIKDDPLFGEVTIFERPFVMKVALNDPSLSMTDISITARSQGCHEPLGICYPPLTQTFNSQISNSASAKVAIQDVDSGDTISVASTDSPTQQVAQLDPQQSSLNSSFNVSGFGQQDQRILTADEAFLMVPIINGENDVTLGFEIAPEHYMYQDKFSITSLNPDIVIEPIQYPQALEKFDEFFGDTLVYFDRVDLNLKLSRYSQDQAFSVEVNYQGCLDKGICYEPISKTIELTLPPLTTPPLDKATRVNVEPAQSDTLSSMATINEDSTAPSSWWGYILSAFIAGLLLTFTPCVLPMIPILAGILQQNTSKKSSSVWIAIAFVMGSATTYSAIGAVAGATGAQLQAYFQNPVALGIFASILFIMSLSMFGLFKIQLPSSIQSKLSNTSPSAKYGRGVYAYGLGLVSALIVGACVSPILIAALSIALQQADPLLGATMMFSMAMGMGVCLILFSLGASYLLPKAGQWMTQVNQLFGFMLIAVAIYLLGVLQQVPVLILWAAWLFVFATFIGAFIKQNNGSFIDTVRKGLGLFVFVWGIAALIGGFMGQREILKPLPLSIFSSGQSGNGTAEQVSTRFNNATDDDVLNQLLASAQSQNKIAMIDYYADWCVDCVRMEKTTFKDGAVASLLNEQFIAIKVDVTDSRNAETQALKKRFGVYGPPATLFIDSSGQLLTEHSFYGYRNATDFLSTLERTLN